MCSYDYGNGNATFCSQQRRLGRIPGESLLNGDKNVIMYGVLVKMCGGFFHDAKCCYEG